jgi:repressor LexA
MIGLTARESDCLAFLRAHVRRTGLAPSVREIETGLSLRSRSRVTEMVCALEEKGYIRRLPRRARAIEVIDLSVCCPKCGHAITAGMAA